jgi:hypothetical protein
MSKSLNRRLARQRRPPDAPDPAERVATLTRTARGTWLGLLAYLAFVGVTLMGVEDADFFLTERQTDLPLIGVSVPTNLFFYIAPTLGAMLYIHMHLYLLKLWKALGEVPSDPDRPAGESVAPWIVSDMALAQHDGASHAYALRSLARWVAILSIFVAGPAVLAAFWWRSMPKHDEVLTILACGLPLFASVLAGWESWRALRRGGAEARHMRRRERAGWGMGAALLSVIGFLATEGTFAAYAQLDRVNLIVTDWAFPSLYSRQKGALVAELEDLASDEQDLSAFKARFEGITEYPDTDDLGYLADRLLERRWWMRTWLPGWLRPAQLQGVVFVETPPGWLPYDEAEQVFRLEWCADQGIADLACGPGPLARGKSAGSRRVTVRGGSILLNVPRAPVSESKFLPRLRWHWCRTVLDQAAPPEDCVALFADLDDLYETDWLKARDDALDALPKRDLSGADLRRADLREARMEGADLSGARMEGANLRGARMEGANLYVARMEGANLRGARMEGAENLDTALLRGAALGNLDWSGVRVSQAQVDGTFGDGSVILPEGIIRPAHWPEWALPPMGEHGFGTQWRKWRDDPDG